MKVSAVGEQHNGHSHFWKSLNLLVSIMLPVNLAVIGVGIAEVRDLHATQMKQAVDIAVMQSEVAAMRTNQTDVRRAVLDNKVKLDELLSRVPHK